MKWEGWNDTFEMSRDSESPPPRGHGRSPPERGHMHYIQDGDPLVSVLSGECSEQFVLHIVSNMDRTKRRELELCFRAASRTTDGELHEIGPPGC